MIFSRKTPSAMAGLTTVLGALLCATAHAELVALDNDDLQAVTGQTGVEVNYVMRLNQTDNGTAGGTFTCGSGTGLTPLKNCRLAIGFNNRDATAQTNGTITTTGAGYKTWVMLKGIQGYMNFQSIYLYGSDIEYSRKAAAGGGTALKAAIALDYDPELPVLIRNYGFSGIAVETDTAINEGSGNTPGYLKMGTGTGASSSTRDDYANGVYTAAGFDQGRETAFLGMNMHGNLVLNGTVKVFSCDATHLRC